MIPTSTLWIPAQTQISEESKLSELNYILTEERGIPSFDPVHSDTLLNVTFMEQVVGTLVKSAWDGRVETYLAESWEVSTDGLSYSFQLREGLKCEDGTPITSELYRKNLIRVFKLYSAVNKSLPVFENLVGFKSFRSSGESISGIVAEGNTLKFLFNKTPYGFLEFLSMPYYGFYCDANFDNSGKWRDPHKIVSSSAWSISSFQNDQVRLTRRKDWGLESYADSPHSVLVQMLPFELAKNLPSKNTIIQKRIESEHEIPSGYRRFLGTPTDLISVVLAPTHGLFENETFRRTFQQAIRGVQEKTEALSQISRLADSFYPNTSSPAALPSRNTTLDTQHSKRQKKLRVVVSNALTNAQSSYVKAVLTSAAELYGLEPVFTGEDRTKPGWKERLDELKDMDIRVARVDIGGSYEPWVVRMMFCSRLGVSFPDPSGRICQLTDQMNDRSEETAIKFEEIVTQDASVIPLFHTAFSWIVSNDIGMDRFSPTANLLRFEAIQTHEL